MPLDQTEQKKPFIHSNIFYSAQNDTILASIWTGGIHVTLSLTERQARAMAVELLAAADAMPRIGTPADLGCEAL